LIRSFGVYRDLFTALAYGPEVTIRLIPATLCSPLQIHAIHEWVQTVQYDGLKLQNLCYKVRAPLPLPRLEMVPCGRSGGLGCSQIVGPRPSPPLNS
jgi:hypothetical protein